MTVSPYKGIKIRTDLMQESNKMMLLCDKLSAQYKTIERYIQIVFYENFVGIEEVLEENAIDQLKDCISVPCSKRSVSTDLRIGFQLGNIDDECFCLPYDNGIYTIYIKVDVDDVNVLNCIQSIKFNSSYKISSIDTYKLCTKN